MGIEGDAKRLSVSSASLLERERELRSAGVTTTGAIVFVYERRVEFLRRPFRIELLRIEGK